MKKFTVSMFTAFFFCITAFFGGQDYAVITGIKAAAFEATSTNEEIDATINFDSTDWSSSTLMTPDYQFLFNEDTFSFYDQLDDNNKAAYDAMKVWINPTIEEVTIALPDPISFQSSSSDLNSWDTETQEEFWTLVLANIKEGKTALNFDYPEIFWIDDSKISVNISNIQTKYSFSNRNYTIKVSEVKVKAAVREEYTDVATATDFQTLFKESVDNFKVEGNDYYSKIKYIHDTIATTVNYNISSPYHYTALGMFLEPYGIVCEGYSKAVKILCDKENIPCITVVGNVNPETAFAHMWNYIKMEDGNWYALDCTWDDLDNNDDPIKYQYFLKGSANFSTNHTPDDTYITPVFTYPELSETDYVYGSGESSVTTTSVTTVPQTQTTVTTTTTSSVVSSTSASTQTTVSSATSTTVVTTTTVSSVTSVTTETTEVTAIKGDFNSNQKLDVGDLVALQRKLLGSLDITDDDMINNDMNDDMKLNIWDYIILLRRIQN